MPTRPAESDLSFLLGQRTMSTTQLRQFSDVFDQLNAQPFKPICIERYGDVGGYVISRELMDMFQLATQGAVRVFRLPVDLGPKQSESLYKQIIATEQPMTDAPFQRWNVLVDSMHYTLSVSIDADERLEPDADQLLWRHHPDVALKVLHVFPFEKK